ncbi:MAG: hypothetical protein M2R45_01500 [Verrucomicrobia subdivision 3 bacterium]|nr:hypothetical protein [Limisphaerales bacterium]MCS1413370.1 hypothetical protein [Limisphaerales bacterium]
MDRMYGLTTSVIFILRHLEKRSLYYPMVLPHWPFVPTPDSTGWANSRHWLTAGLKHAEEMIEYVDKVAGQDR